MKQKKNNIKSVDTLMTSSKPKSFTKSEGFVIFAKTDSILKEYYFGVVI